MSGRRYSRRELYELRNHIPIGDLITHLEIPSRLESGRCRFCCPICASFQTSVNPGKNLARCFACEKNFNTIDLVMEVHNTSFRESTEYLKRFKFNSLPLSSETPHQSNDASKTSNVPVSVGDVIASMDILQQKPAFMRHQDWKQICDRILKLEQQISSLSKRILDIESRR